MAADIKPFIADAQRLETETGIPASITLGQIILESSGRFAGGLSGLAAQAKNLFGVKGTGNAGSVLLPTSEVYNGKVTTVQAQFKKYNSYYDSLVDHARVLSLPRYQTHLASATTVNEFAHGIKAGGYATDPQYAEKLLGVIQSNNLTQYDSGKVGYTPMDTGSSSTGSTETGSVQTDNKNSFVENIYFHTIKIVALLLLFILMVVFFLKAFPAVEDVASNVVPPGKVLKVAKSLKGVKK